MAPDDRLERRQQRVRGAGPAPILAKFDFNLLARNPTLSPSLAQTASRTPTAFSSGSHINTGSSRQVHTDLSQQINHSQPRPRITPKFRSTIPQPRKKKRFLLGAYTNGTEDGTDELSPDHDKHVHTVIETQRFEKASALPRDYSDIVPDELSLVEIEDRDMRGTTIVVSKSASSPVISSRHLYKGRPARSPMVSGNLLGGPVESIVAAQDVPPAQQLGDDYNDEDELSPRPQLATFPIGAPATTRLLPYNGDEADELSSPLVPLIARARDVPSTHGSPRPSATEYHKRSQSTLPTQNPLGRIRHSILSTRAPKLSEMSAEKSPDKLTVSGIGSPDTEEPYPGRQSTNQSRKKRPAPTQDGVSIELGGPSNRGLKRSRLSHRSQPKAKGQQDTQSPNVAKGTIVRKHQKQVGPKQNIMVMRWTGASGKGITIADTARTALGEKLDIQVSRLAGKMRQSQNAAHRRAIRAEINLTLAFKESLDEKLLDLQDANDMLGASLRKRRLLRNDNMKQRKELLLVQLARQEVMQEVDDQQLSFNMSKDALLTKQQLSADMFAIQAAVRKGRRRGQSDGKENEGPKMPLSMLLQGVGVDVGLHRGGRERGVWGLLGQVRRLNADSLHTAATWLESRI